MTNDPHRSRRPTISQVAAASGVARSSVSRAFNSPSMLGQETVQRILRVAAELGYVPDRTARALSTGRTRNLAIIVPDIANPFFPPVIEAAQACADRHDHCVFLGSTGEDPRQEDRLAERFAGQVDGLILVSSRLPEDRILHHAARCPLVLVNRDVMGIPRVLIDSGQGVGQAIAHLAMMGHRHVLYLGGPRHSWSNRQRLAAARQAAREFGIELATLPAKMPTHDAGREAADSILATGVTAVIAFDDLLAQGVMAGLSERGVPVPGGISVIGCDDVLGAATYPALTTVSNRSTEAGNRAMSLLMDVLATGNLGDARFVLATELVERNSTAPHEPDAGSRVDQLVISSDPESALSQGS